jgi:hypothetical protein
MSLQDNVSNKRLTDIPRETIVIYMDRYGEPRRQSIAGRTGQLTKQLEDKGCEKGGGRLIPIDGQTRRLHGN